MSGYRDDILEYLENRLFQYPEIEPKKIFGHPGFSIINRIFCFVYEDGLSIKLPRETYTRLLEEDQNTAPFTPRKSPMGTWVVLTLPDPQDYDGYWKLIEEAMDYIITPEANPKKR